MWFVSFASPIKAAPCVVHVRQSSAVSPADCAAFNHLGEQRRQLAALHCFKPVKAASSNSPPLLVPLLSTVGINHPAQVWALQGPGRVQQRLHQCRRAAVHAHGQQLQGPAGHLHGVSKEAAIWNAPPVLCRVSCSVWSMWIWTLDFHLFLSKANKQIDYLAGEGEPGSRVGKLSEQLGHSLRFLDTGNCFKSKKIGSCCRQTLHLRPVPIF